MAKAKRIIDRKPNLFELIRVYEDLERTLHELKSFAGSQVRATPLKYIDLRQLIDRLAQSKLQLERKIGSTLALRAKCPN